MIGLELEELKAISPEFKYGLIESLTQQNIKLHFSTTDKKHELAVNVFDIRNKQWLLVARGKTSTANRIKPTFIVYKDLEIPTESNTSPYTIALICADVILRGSKKRNKKPISEIYKEVYSEYEEVLLSISTNPSSL